jgi:hypothetical protein
VYREFAEKLLNESLTNKNKLTVDTQKLEQRITEEFPEFSDASISLPLLGHRPVVALTTEKPVLLVASQEGVFAVNKNGRAVVKANGNQSVEGLTLPVVRDEAGIEVGLGKGVLTSQDVAFITTIVKQFDDKKIGIDSITLPPLASELHVRTTGDKYFIKFSLLTDPRIASGQYFAIRKKIVAGTIKPSEYVDSRVEEKVFVK